MLPVTKHYGCEADCEAADSVEDPWNMSDKVDYDADGNMLTDFDTCLDFQASAEG